jgi:hypothetical protein
MEQKRRQKADEQILHAGAILTKEAGLLDEVTAAFGK